jgi:hypothetical protein
MRGQPQITTASRHSATPAAQRRWKNKMASDFELNTLAEIAALNMVIHRLLTYVAKSSADSRSFLAKELELGLEGISASQHWSVSHSAQKKLIEIAKARYTEIIGAIREH